MITTSVRSIPPITAATDVSLSRPSTLTISDQATSPESAKTSPWAKLISCRIP